MLEDMQMDNLIIRDNIPYLSVSSNVFNLKIPAKLNLSPLGKLDEKKLLDPVEWLVPKPSSHFLFAFLDMAAQVYNKHGAEMEAFILWDEVNQKHVLFIPEQTVSAASCNFDMNQIPEKHVLLVDMHSHHTMSCSFSSIDDHSDSNLDLVPHISLVIKSIQKFNWNKLGENVDIRLSVWNNRYPLSVDNVFNFAPFPVDKIKKQAVMTGKVADGVYPGMGYYGGAYAGKNKNITGVIKPISNTRTVPPFGIPAVERGDVLPPIGTHGGYIWDNEEDNVDPFDRLETPDTVNSAANAEITNDKLKTLFNADHTKELIVAGSKAGKSTKNSKRTKLSKIGKKG